MPDNALLTPALPTTAMQDAHTQAPSLKGRRIVVSGGTTGIGRATARLLAAEGAKLFIFGRHQAELDDALQSIKDVGGDVSGIAADASKAEDVERVFAEADKALGGLDVLIANAAVKAAGLSEMEDADWRYAVESNLMGYLACAKAAIPRLEGVEGAQVVLVGSVSAEVYSEDSSVYVATKAGIQGFALAFRKEMAKKNVRVTLIEPGLVGADLQDMPVEKQRDLIHKHEMLRAEDIAVSIHYVLTQPSRSNVVSLRVEPILQKQ